MINTTEFNITSALIDKQTREIVPILKANSKIARFNGQGKGRLESVLVINAWQTKYKYSCQIMCHYRITQKFVLETIEDKR